MMENKTKIDLKNTSIFITGAAGFIGSNLAKRILTTVEGAKVVGLDNMNHYYDVRLKEARLDELNKFENFSFVKGNLADPHVSGNCNRSGSGAVESEVVGVHNGIMWMNPLSDVMGGWGIWETVNGERQLTTECIENVIMMVPFSAVVLWTFGEKIENSLKKILWQSGKIAFCFSISIEMLQLLLRLGTFQLSDIFYNTVGGALGGLLYYVAMKARKRL